jgi:hypothetical protein
MTAKNVAVRLASYREGKRNDPSPDGSEEYRRTVFEGEFEPGQWARWTLILGKFQGEWDAWIETSLVIQGREALWRKRYVEGSEAQIAAATGALDAALAPHGPLGSAYTTPAK